MDTARLQAIIEVQEESIIRLEQELQHLKSAQNKEEGAWCYFLEENILASKWIFTEVVVEKLRLANEKLRYRLIILRAATAREMSHQMSRAASDTGEEQVNSVMISA